MARISHHSHKAPYYAGRMNKAPQTTIGLVYRLDRTALVTMRKSWVNLYGEKSNQVAIIDHRLATAAR